MMTTLSGQEEAKGGGALMGLGAAAAGAGGDQGALENGSAGGGAAGPYGGASRKLEELFTYWLSQKETAEMVEHCVTAVRQGQALPCESALEVRVHGMVVDDGDWIRQRCAVGWGLDFWADKRGGGG
jgi:hypothetical protein